jgi:hypothetical protein
VAESSWKDAVRARSVPLRVDVMIGVLLFVTAAAWSAASWKRAVAHGQPFYYQHYFEPAVMIACGKGFVVSQPPLPAVSAFLQQRVDRFSCDAIPAGANLGTEGLYQAPWRYLMFGVGLSWRVLGVSWSGLGPLFGTLFGATITAAYAIFRLGMSPLLGVLGSYALSVSSLHLINLPQLRDYAKAPFTLILVCLLGVLVTRRATWKGILTVSAVYGAVLGVGYGVRTDFLANIPPFFLALAGFLEGGVFKNLRLKAAAGAVCAAVFLFVAWPIVSSVYRSGGCQWHTVILGLARQFSDPLGIEDAPYDANREYLDDYAYVNVTSSAARMRPGVGHIEYCQHEYDQVTARYLFDVVRHFPADMVVRAYASTLRIVELPFAPRLMLDVATGEPKFDYNRGHGVGLVAVVAALALAMAASWRIGLFLVFFLLYFGAYPALQFDPRHFFHLEFIAWWAFGFILQCAVADVWPLVQNARWEVVRRDTLRAALPLSGCAVALAAILWAARLYQQVEVRTFLQQYIDAPKDDVPVDEATSANSLRFLRMAPQTDPETADFLEVDVNGWRCADRSTVTFRYGVDMATRKAFSRMFRVDHRDTAHDVTRIFMPVYDRFQGIDFSDSRSGCVDGVYRLPDVKQPLLLEVILTPGWQNAPLYQRLKGTGVDW